MYYDCVYHIYLYIYIYIVFCLYFVFCSLFIYTHCICMWRKCGENLEDCSQHPQIQARNTRMLCICIICITCIICICIYVYICIYVLYAYMHIICVHMYICVVCICIYVYIDIFMFADDMHTYAISQGTEFSEISARLDALRNNHFSGIYLLAICACMQCIRALSFQNFLAGSTFCRALAQLLLLPGI